MSSKSTVFRNCRLCLNGKLLGKERLVVSHNTGDILDASSDSDGEVIDLGGAIIAPGFLELQSNGMRGFHFTHFQDEESYAKKLDDIARYLPSQGVTGFWATIPTVASEEFKKVR